MLEAHDALTSCVEVSGVFKYMETNQLATHHRLQNLESVRKYLENIGGGARVNARKSRYSKTCSCAWWVWAEAVSRCRGSKWALLLNHVRRTGAEDLVHLVEAAPKLLFAQIVLEVVQGFKVVEKVFDHSFVELEHLVVQFLRQPDRHTVVGN